MKLPRGPNDWRLCPGCYGSGWVKEEWAKGIRESLKQPDTVQHYCACKKGMELFERRQAS